jgi:trk system potassium uptake protein TrkA
LPRKKRKIRKSSRYKKNFLIVGCGRFGSFLANRLSAEGNGVIIIDVNPDAFKALSPEFSGFALEGDATEFNILEKAKISQADVLIASTRDDNINLMVGQVASKICGVPYVFARVFNPKRVEIFRELGIQTICPPLIAGEKLLGIIDKSLKKQMED